MALQTYFAAARLLWGGLHTQSRVSPASFATDVRLTRSMGRRSRPRRLVEGEVVQCRTGSRAIVTCNAWGHVGGGACHLMSKSGRRRCSRTAAAYRRDLIPPVSPPHWLWWLQPWIGDAQPARRHIIYHGDNATCYLREAALGAGFRLLVDCARRHGRVPKYCNRNAYACACLMSVAAHGSTGSALE